MTVLDWLLDSDPAIRWQVLRDLTDAPAAEVAAERARVGREGWGAQVLAAQADDGTWGGEAFNQEWDSTYHALRLLRDLGLDPAGEEARRAVDLVREQVHWRGWGMDGKFHGWDVVGNAFFDGEVEPCINGQVASAAAYFGEDTSRIRGLLLAERLDDGGWNCEAERGSKRSSFNTTICVLEALLEYERANGRRDDVTAARLRGQEYLLDRRLFRRLSTGEAIPRDRQSYAVFSQFAFPTWWHYDVLRGLDYLRDAGVTPDERVADAIALVESKRDADGRWPLDILYPGRIPVDLGEVAGQPSKWNTLRAMRVLRWYGRA